MNTSINLVNWNVQWCTPRSQRLHEIRHRIWDCTPDIVCLTETHEDLLSDADGHTIASQSDYGYPIKAGRRKVMLWSRTPWRDVDELGMDNLPPGRFVSGITDTELGTTRVVGICIPWSGSRTEARREHQRKRRWEDHEAYLDRLPDILRGYSGAKLVVMGDFNQRIGEGSHAPKRLQAKLKSVFEQKLRIVTANLELDGGKSIDHVALTRDLSAHSTSVIDNRADRRPKTLSDHFGVSVEVRGYIGD